MSDQQHELDKCPGKARQYLFQIGESEMAEREGVQWEKQIFVMWGSEGKLGRTNETRKMKYQVKSFGERLRGL